MMGRGDILSAPSPNFGDRREGAEPELIVLHYTAMESAEAALERLCDPLAEVSAHYLIGETGVIWQLVDEDKRAWHAGAGQWRGITDVNSRSIGIELANTGAHPFSEPQMALLEALMRGIMTRWAIPAQNVIAHADMAPARKCDPGRRFDWRRLALQGLSVWPSPSRAEESPQGLEEALAGFGYPVAEQGFDACLRAFRDRFRPWVHGTPDDRDAVLARDLAGRFGVDLKRASA